MPDRSVAFGVIKKYLMGEVKFGQEAVEPNRVLNGHARIGLPMMEQDRGLQLFKVKPGRAIGKDGAPGLPGQTAG